MHFVWSTVQNPTLYLSHTPNVNNSCSCNGSQYNKDYPRNQNSTVLIPGLDGPFSLAIIFTRIVEFNATGSGLAGEALNLTEACTDDDTNLHFTDFSNNSNIDWHFDSDSTTFVGTINHVNSTDNTTIRIRVSRTRCDMWS